MSNASGPSDSIPPDKSPVPAGGIADGMELGLWELDSNTGENPYSDLNKNTDPAVFPSRRDGEHSMISTTPPERQIYQSEQPWGREEAMMGDDPTEIAILENQTSQPPGDMGTIIRSFSVIEKVAIVALSAIFAVGTTLSILHFSNKIPTQSVLRPKLHLPAEGKFVKVTSLDTFWRKPVIAGKEPDVVRRGTKIIPVVNLQVEAETAAIRILFRDGEGAVIGDPINRTINGKIELRIPATAGFEDIGMHAGYRTGGSHPWTIHILEAKESSLSGDHFHQVLQTEISPDIR